ncbi:MAG: BsaJI [Parcubacteria group bacterium GW2011_GWC1_40_13]|nr:MAG: BsaJI [Parcubacteria group bacterium GW2011_GWC1_40_13]
MVEINKNIFKSYDIRGIYPSELSEEVAFAIGKAFVRQTGIKKIAVGQDARIASPVLFRGLARGVAAQGGQIYDIGQVLTECLYFTIGSRDFKAGVMITASHNPKEYGGFKMVKKDDNYIKIIAGKDLLDQVVKDNSENVDPADDKILEVAEEKIIKEDIWHDYINHVLSFVDLSEISPLKIVIDASNEHYDTLYEAIKNLVDTEHDLDLTLTVKFKGVSVDLNVSESLIVINTLAVKRSALRGGLWSTAGKRVEKPLMQTLCKLYGVSESNYSLKIKGKEIEKDDFEREIDFYLIEGKNQYKCEIKLMGRGNPESADAVIARDSKVFVADKLSDTNKKQLTSRKVEWVELRSDGGFERFDIVLKNLKIPHTKLSHNVDKELEIIFKEIF